MGDRLRVRTDGIGFVYTYIKCALISLFIMVIIMLIMVCMIFFK